LATKGASVKAVDKFADLKRRLWFLLLALIVYRIGAHVPVPGIDPITLKELFDSQESSVLGMFNMFSGGALSRFSIFALGIMPYISASIIMQLGTVAVPYLEALKKEGESGRRKITQYVSVSLSSKLWDFSCPAISTRFSYTTWWNVCTYDRHNISYRYHLFNVAG